MSVKFSARKRKAKHSLEEKTAKIVYESAKDSKKEYFAHKKLQEKWAASEGWRLYIR